MGNNPSRVVGCFVSSGKADLDFLEPLDDGLGHSFCYVRPVLFDSPAITPSNSERFTVDSSTLDSETLSGSFRHDSVEDAACLHRPNKCFPETTFRTISGASVSANVSTARTGNHNALFSSDTQEPAASFESTSSFAAIPLQPLPRGSGPLNLNGFMSGPLERGFASGPLDKGGGFMSGPIEKGVMSGPLDVADKSNFSAPLALGGRRRPGLKRFMRSVSGPMRSTLSRTFTRNSYGSGWMQRFFLRPVTQLPWNSRELKIRTEVSRNFDEGVPLEVEYRETQDLQWAHGKAGEDRVHVVLSEEQGWLFIGIYDGFSGPDAPDFLMTHLYRAIDKEMGGLLWDCEDKSDDCEVKTGLPDNDNVKHISEGSKQVLAFDPSQIRPFGLQGTTNGLSSNCEQRQDGDESREIFETPACDKPSNLDTASVGSQEPTLAGQGRKSKRLYELLQMEAWDGQSFKSVLHEGSDDPQGSLDVMCFKGSTQGEQSNSCSLNPKAGRCIHLREEPCISGKDNLVGTEANDHSVVSSISRKMSTTGKSNLSSKIRSMYRKQKSLHKKLFPWSYDWHREDAHVKEKTSEPLGTTRRCKSGTVDHDAVLRAMSRALQNTEEAYMEMVEQNFDRNPELALMGSCVLVMLMKDQDVYVMNLGDSRAVLAQERPNGHHLNLNLLKDDMRNRNRSRESLVRMELDRISEESPVHNQTCQANKTTKSKEILLCGLKMRAIQLSADHSTSVKEEILRIKEEHLDDNQAILNDRVKGQLKVTRAFGAGFLKKPQCNNGLLEMFRIEYVGTAPYVSCIPFIHHHRLSSNDRFLVLSSDGLYQYFSNEDVVAHVTWFMENVPEGDPAQYLVSELLTRAAKKNGMDFHELLDIPHGDRRKYHDDVSVMVVSLEGRIWRSSGWPTYVHRYGSTKRCNLYQLVVNSHV